jgi:integrase
MARQTRSSQLETRSARLRLPISRKAKFVKLAPGLGLGYRRTQTGGTWVCRGADGKGGNWEKALGIADDFAEANGETVFDFWGAQERAKSIAAGPVAGAERNRAKPITVAEALDAYEADLKMRGGDPHNAERVRVHLSPTLAGTPVAILTKLDFTHWRSGLRKKGLAPSSINRVASMFKAACNLAASHDERINNQSAWTGGLKNLSDATETRNVILADQPVRKIVETAYAVEREFGLLVEVAAFTGARVSQIARITVADLQDERADPRLMMPVSRKGRGQKKIPLRPVPIPADLAERLRAAAGERSSSAPLLMKASGEPWKKSDHAKRFDKVAAKLTLDAEVTLAALRHSSIVRQLLKGVPTRVVAVNHDTSVQMLERTYSAHITEHSDGATRAALLPSAPPAAAASNVVRMRPGP